MIKFLIVIFIGLIFLRGYIPAVDKFLEPFDYIVGVALILATLFFLGWLVSLI